MAQPAMTMTGADELEKALMRLERNVGKKVVRKAMRKGAGITRKETRTNAKRMVGGEMGALLAKHVIVKPAKKQRKGSYFLSVMMRPDVAAFVHKAKKSKYPKKKTYIPVAIEYGHDGGMALPFMRQAAASTRNRSFNAIKTSLKTGIEQLSK